MDEIKELRKIAMKALNEDDVEGYHRVCNEISKLKNIKRVKEFKENHSHLFIKHPVSKDKKIANIIEDVRCNIPFPVIAKNRGVKINYVKSLSRRFNISQERMIMVKTCLDAELDPAIIAELTGMNPQTVAIYVSKINRGERI